MKILITGSSGYLGSNFICQYRNIYEFDKFSLQSQSFEDIKFDNIDVVLHCAALVHKKENLPYDKYYEINVNYPVNLAKLAKLNGVRQFIYISTIAVYGEHEERLNEETPCNPVTSYGKSKYEAEKQLLELNDENFIVSIIRIPMIYGKNAPGNIDSLVKFVKKFSIIPLNGIKNKKSFIFIENLCYLINIVIIQKKGGVFLSSDDTSLSTTRLLELISKNLDKKVYLIKIPFFENLLKVIKPSFYKKLYRNSEVDNNITKKKLMLTYPYTVEEGIKLMIKGEMT